MDIHEAKSLIDSKKVVIVDIRDEAAFHEAHIPGAVHLTNKTAEEFVAKTDKSKTIICCCYHGISSRNAAAFLSAQGFENVHSLDGGFEAWRGVYPCESNA